MTGRAGWITAGLMVLATFFVIGLVAEAFAPAPQGPALSSFSTTPDGVAGWAALLQRAGHPVSQLRAPIAAAPLRSGTTLVVLAASPLSTADARRLTRFVTSGGRLVIGGPGARTYSATLPRQPGPPQSTLGSGTIARTLGSGRAFLLANPAPLENRDLATADNAELSLQLAGPAARPVAFAESIHGFGPATGLAAFPRRWWVAVSLLALAAGAFVLARGRRLGGPDPLPTATPSPRSAYLEAMAATLRRTADRGRLGELARDREFTQPDGGGV